MTQTVTQPLVEVLVPIVEMDKGEREYRTFLRLLPELLFAVETLEALFETVPLPNDMLAKRPALQLLRDRDPRG